MSIFPGTFCAGRKDLKSLRPIWRDRIKACPNAALSPVPGPTNCRRCGSFSHAGPSVHFSPHLRTKLSNWFNWPFIHPFIMVIIPMTCNATQAWEKCFENSWADNKVVCAVFAARVNNSGLREIARGSNKMDLSRLRLIMTAGLGPRSVNKQSHDEPQSHPSLDADK